MAVSAQTPAIPGLGWTERQLGGVLGILGVILFIVGVIVQGDTPMVSDSPEEIRTWFVDNGEQFLIGDFIVSLAIIFGLVPFFIAIRREFARLEGESSLWPQLGQIGGFLFVVVGAAASMFQGALAVGAEQITDDSAIMALMNASFYGFSAPGFVLSLFFISSAMSIMRTKAFAAWLAWLCLALTVVAVLSGLAAIEDDQEGIFSLLGFVTIIGFGIVTLVLSFGLLTRKDK
jgi:hypothetical protein